MCNTSQLDAQENLDETKCAHVRARISLALRKHNQAAGCTYDDYSKECVVCKEDFKVGEPLVKLACSHVMHQQCINDVMDHCDNENMARSCPMCRRTLVPTLHTKWIAQASEVIASRPITPDQSRSASVDNSKLDDLQPSDREIRRALESVLPRGNEPRTTDIEGLKNDEEPTPPKSTSGMSMSGSSTSWDKVTYPTLDAPTTPTHGTSNPLGDFFPSPGAGHSYTVTTKLVDGWGDMKKWLKPDELPLPANYYQMNEESKQAYHSSTELPDGRIGALIDPGSKGNGAGEKWIMKMIERCEKMGISPEIVKRAYPLDLNGVGDNTQRCTHDVGFPTAIQGRRGMIGGNIRMPWIPQPDVPCLLGLDSMADLEAILDIGGRRLIIPGKSGVKIILGEDSEEIKLYPSPSGHLIMPIDLFEKMPADPMQCPQLALFLNSDHTRSHVQDVTVDPLEGCPEDLGSAHNEIFWETYDRY